MDLTYRIVRRLLREDEVGFSRNRHFEAYEDRAVQRAVRLYRHLRSLEKDLLRLEDPQEAKLVALVEDEEEVTVRLVFAEEESRRTSYLSRKEWQLLLENERVSAILHDLLEQADPSTRRALSLDSSLEPR